MRKLGGQKLGLGLGFALGVGLTVGALFLAFALGARDSKKNTSARRAPGRHVIYTLRRGNVVRDPRTGTRCEATGEGGIPNLRCTHTARGRYEAVFWSDELQVYGPGSGPMMPRYAFKWWPRLR